MGNHQELIKKFAMEIKDKIHGGTLFGESIDENDLDSMIVATRFCYEQIMYSQNKQIWSVK